MKSSQGAMVDQGSTSQDAYLPRAKRFPVEMPVRYRESDAVGWSEGTTENISYSGMLFRAEHILQPKTAVEGRLLLPAVIPGELSAELVFRGVVVRTAPATSACAHGALAVSILEYRFERGGQAPVTESVGNV